MRRKVRGKLMVMMQKLKNNCQMTMMTLIMMAIALKMRTIKLMTSAPQKQSQVAVDGIKNWK